MRTHAAAEPTDVAGRQRHVHQRAIGAVVVVAPDDALLIGEHRAAPLPPSFGIRDPLCRLDDVGGLRPVIFAASSIDVLHPSLAPASPDRFGG